MVRIISTLRSLALRIPKTQGETIRNKLSDIDALDRGLAIIRDGDFLYLPITHDPELQELTGFEITELEFEVLTPKNRTYRDVVEVPENLRENLPTSYDIIGQIAVFKLDEELLPYKTQIADAMLQVHSNLKTVALDRGVKGEYRIRDLEIIAGSTNTETIHTEYGLRFAVDLSEAYFSPRLSQEHYRIAQKIQNGERVIDMFAGVGPFAIMIARYSKPAIIYAIDKNPKAIEYLKKNIELNSIENIEPICDDAKIAVHNLVDQELSDKADRIIMNLPHAAKEFMVDALEAIKVGGMIHYHEIMDNDHFEDRVIGVIKEVVEYGFDTEVETKLIIGTYSPSETHVCLDLKILAKNINYAKNNSTSH